MIKYDLNIELVQIALIQYKQMNGTPLIQILPFHIALGVRKNLTSNLSDLAEI